MYEIYREQQGVVLKSGAGPKPENTWSSFGFLSLEASISLHLPLHLRWHNIQAVSTTQAVAEALSSSAL